MEEQAQVSSELEVRVESKVGLLNWNFEQLNEQLDIQLKKYQGLQFSSEEMQEAKKTRAKLNSVAKQLNDEKIKRKKEFCKPYDDFADQVKQLTAKIKACSDGIDVQIKAYEEARKAEKKKEIEEYWNQFKLALPIPFEKVFEEKYLNATCSSAQWQADLESKRKQIDNDLTNIAFTKDIDQLNFMSVDYLKTLNLSTTLSNWHEHVEQLKKAEEFKAQAEARRKQQETQNDTKVETLAQPVNPSKNEEKVAKTEDYEQLQPTDYLYSPTFKILDATYEQMIELTKFFKNNGIRFQSIAKEKKVRG